MLMNQMSFVPVCGWLERALVARVDIAEGLRIAIDEREPGALHLHHHAMALAEAMANVWHAERDC